MVHRPVRRHETTLRRQRGGGRDAGNGFGRVGEPEKGETVAIADVEEEMLATPAGQVDRLGKWHAELVAIEFDRLRHIRSEEHTSELQSLMRISYAVFCLKKKRTNIQKSTPSQ